MSKIRLDRHRLRDVDGAGRAAVRGPLDAGMVGQGEGKREEAGERKIKQWHHAALMVAAGACLHIVLRKLTVAPCLMAVAPSGTKVAEIGGFHGAMGRGAARLSVFGSDLEARR